MSIVKSLSEREFTWALAAMGSDASNSLPEVAAGVMDHDSSNVLRLVNGVITAAGDTGDESARPDCLRAQSLSRRTVKGGKL